MSFRYFANPHVPLFSTWTEEARECELCRRTGSAYEGPYYGSGELDFVCEPCLGGGRLAEHGFRTNQGEAGPPPERVEELEFRTPHLVTWQDIVWPAHCDDYCRFESIVGRQELDRISGGDGFDFFIRHLHRGQTPLEPDEVPPRAPQAPEEGCSPCIYFFRCLVCETPVFLWDMD